LLLVAELSLGLQPEAGAWQTTKGNQPMIAAASAPATADRLLASQIAMQLAESNRASLKRLSVNVSAGEVTLRGRVGSFYEKQIAIQACRLLAGIDRLVDAVEVVALE
jgi:osmotically-inducible protein OsmY